MTKQTEAMKLALEALESCDAAHITDGGHQWYDEKLVDTAYAALREALVEQPAQQEPVAWGNFKEDGTLVGLSQHPEDQANWTGRKPLYTSPPAQRKPLTDEQIKEIANNSYSPYQSAVISFAREIEAAHGIKGEA